MSDMTLVWLPEDDWAENLHVPPGLDVEVWRSGQPVPASVAEVALYVPDYMGPAGTLDVIREMTSLRVVQTLTAGVDDVLAVIPDQCDPLQCRWCA